MGESEERKQIKKLGFFKQEILNYFTNMPPTYKFTKVTYGDEHGNFETIVFVEYSLVHAEWTISSIMYDGRLDDHHFVRCNLTVEELEAFIAFVKTLKPIKEEK